MTKGKTSFMELIEELISEDTIIEHAYPAGHKPSAPIFSPVESDLRFSTRLQNVIEASLILGSTSSYKCVYNCAVRIQYSHSEPEWDYLEQLEQFELRRNIAANKGELNLHNLEGRVDSRAEGTPLEGTGSRELRALVKKRLTEHRQAFLN